MRDGFRRDGVLRLLRGRADVMRADHVRQTDQRIAELAGRRCGLLREHIQRHANAGAFRTTSASADVVDDLAAGRVDEVRAWLQPIEDRRADESDGVSAVSARCTLRTSLPAATSSGPLDDRDVEIVGQLGDRRSGVATETPAPDQHGHPERAARAARPPDRCCRNRGCPASGRTALSPSSTPSCSTFPRAGPRRCPECAGRARGSAEGQLRDRDRVLARTVRHVDAAA